jgi:hypothetical protein
MSSPSTEQTLHDKVNLGRLVRRLEKSITQEEWNDSARHDTWIKAQATLQKLKYARKLLKNVELYDADPSPKSAKRFNDFKIVLDKVESFVVILEQRVAPQQTRPEPLLPTIPIPTSPDELVLSATLENSGAEEAAGISPPPLHTEDLLLLPSDSSTIFTPPTLIPPTLPAPATKSTVTATATAMPNLQNSTALQQELSDQLSQMAAQLRRNAIYFSESLEKDKAVVEAAQVKIEDNFDVMKTERLRLRDLRGKSGSTTCLVLTSVIVVAVSVVFMFLLIRVT